MPRVDLADDSFVVAPPAAVAERLRDPAFWRECWPGVELTAYHDRGAEGLRWYAAGALVGTAELWLEPFRDGTVVHVFLRADPAPDRTGRPLDRLRRRYATALKSALFAVKDDMEADRLPGTRRDDRAARLAAHRSTEPARSGIGRLLSDVVSDVVSGSQGGGAGPLTLVGVERIDGGIATATHRLRVTDGHGRRRDLVLKRYLADDDTAASEWDRLRFARRCEVPTPDPVGVDLDGRWFGTSALVMEALPGAVRYDQPDPKAWVTELARALAGIHRTDLSPPVPDACRRPPWWRSFDPAALPDSWRGRRADAVARAITQLRTAARDRPEVFCHGDFHPGNVLFEGGTVSGVVDWSAARVQPAEADVANCRAELALVGADLPDLFAAAYVVASGSQLERLPWWDILAGAGMTGWMPYAGGVVNQGAAAITPEVAMTRIETFVDEATAAAEGPAPR